MEENNGSLCLNQKPLLSSRIAAGAVLGVILVGSILLWASAKGHLNLSFWLGICGFKQRFGLPCPGCGWTHAAQLFVTGHWLKAFWIQPAAAFFCVAAAVVAVFALLYSLFGIFIFPLQNVFCPRGVSILLITACGVILMGWMVTLVRTILET
jgi:hypothetical protein